MGAQTTLQYASPGIGAIGRIEKDFVVYYSVPRYLWSDPTFWLALGFSSAAVSYIFYADLREALAIGVLRGAIVIGLILVAVSICAKMSQALATKLHPRWSLRITRSTMELRYRNRRGSGSLGFLRQKLAKVVVVRNDEGLALTVVLADGPQKTLLWFQSATANDGLQIARDLATRLALPLVEESPPAEVLPV